MLSNRKAGGPRSARFVFGLGNSDMDRPGRRGLAAHGPGVSLSAMAEKSQAKLRTQRPFSRELRKGHSACVSAVRDVRSLRGEYFPADLFGEPAWDILLDLYEAKLAEFRLSVSSVCIGTGLPATTALRWLKALEVQGYVERRPDPNDRRRIYVEVTSKAVDAMDRLFNAIEGRLADL